jgi:hypothetical protein
MTKTIDIMAMILVITQMNVLSEKRLELSQTIASLSCSIRMEKGCQRCDFCQIIELMFFWCDGRGLTALCP